MIPHNEWANPDRDICYDFDKIVEVLDYEIKRCKDPLLHNPTFLNRYRFFRLAGMWVCNVESKFGLTPEDIDLFKIRKKLGGINFFDLYEYVCNTLYESSIPDISELRIDLDQFYYDFKSLDSQFY